MQLSPMATLVFQASPTALSTQHDIDESFVITKQEENLLFLFRSLINCPMTGIRKEFANRPKIMAEFSIQCPSPKFSRQFPKKFLPCRLCRSTLILHKDRRFTYNTIICHTQFLSQQNTHTKAQHEHANSTYMR